MKTLLSVLTIGLVLLGFAFWINSASSQTCMQMGSMYQCSDGTQGMRMPGGMSQWSRPDGSMGSSMDLGPNTGMGSFQETAPSGQTRSGTYFGQGKQGMWQDQQGRHGQWQDIGPNMRQFSGQDSPGTYGPPPE